MVFLFFLKMIQVLNLGEKIFGSDVLPLLDPETKAKPADLSKNYGNLCLAADGFAQVFPEHKYLIVECLREMGYSVGMTGMSGLFVECNSVDAFRDII